MQSLLPDETDLARRTTLHTMLGADHAHLDHAQGPGQLRAAVAVATQPFDLNDLVRETLRLVAYNSRFQGITFEPQLATDLARPSPTAMRSSRC